MRNCFLLKLSMDFMQQYKHAVCENCCVIRTVLKHVFGTTSCTDVLMFFLLFSTGHRERNKEKRKRRHVLFCIGSSDYDIWSLVSVPIVNSLPAMHLWGLASVLRKVLHLIDKIVYVFANISRVIFKIA